MIVHQKILTADMYTCAKFFVSLQVQILILTTVNDDYHDNNVAAINLSQIDPTDEPLYFCHQFRCSCKKLKLHTTSATPKLLF